MRSLLHAHGFRFRKDWAVRVGEIRVRPDIVFPRLRVAVFVDGCFWHRCPEHAVLPKANRDYWEPKLDANVSRDRDVDAALRDAGWTVVRVWEHVAPDDAAELVASVLRTAGKA